MTFKRILMGAGAIVVLGLLSTQKVTAAETNCYRNSDGTVVCYTCYSNGVCEKHYPSKEK